jgi:hypothetical protein
MGLLRRTGVDNQQFLLKAIYIKAGSNRKDNSKHGGTAKEVKAKPRTPEEKSC